MSAMPDIAVVAVDWGTTNLRVWAVDRAGNIIDVRKSTEGMASTAKGDYPKILETHLQALGAAPSVPVIICGMAGSRQGWQEAKYIDMPTALDTVAAKSISVSGVDRDIRILPGIAKKDARAPDVMRSEETQLLALVDAGHSSGTICMPGTHAKWVTLINGEVRDFRTAMTGELYDIVATHSVLKHAVSGHIPDATSVAFSDGVHQSLSAPSQTLAQLFTIRAATLLHGTGPQHSADRLSGLLIGLDVAASLELAGSDAVTLVGGNALGVAYEKALVLANASVTQIDGDGLSLAGLTVAARQVWPSRFAAPQHARKTGMA